MFNNHNIGLPQPTRFRRDVPDRPDPDDCCLSCCRTFCIAFTFTGFVSSLISGLYFLFLMDTSYFPFFLISAAICLAVMIHLITTERPLPPPSLLSDPVIIRRTTIPRAALSLPAYIVVPPSERGENESSAASTESTLSAEENRERTDEEASGSSQKTDVPPLDAEELEEATEAVVKVVDETLQGFGAPEVSEGLAWRLAEGARTLVLEGVRQRRQPPNEPQMNVPSPEDEKAE